MCENFSFAYNLDKLNIKASIKNNLFFTVFRVFYCGTVILVIRHLCFINTQANSAYRKLAPIEK